MLAKLKMWGAAVLGFILLIVGAFYSGRADGKKTEKLDRANESASSMRKAREIEKDVDKMSSSDVRDSISYRM